MKITSSFDQFHPIELIFTIETAAEAAAIYALFNYAPVTQVIREYIDGGITLSIRDKVDFIMDDEVSDKLHDAFCAMRKGETK